MNAETKAMRDHIESRVASMEELLASGCAPTEEQEALKNILTQAKADLASIDAGELWAERIAP